MHMGSWGKKCCPSISFETAQRQSAWIRSCSQGWSDMSDIKAWFCSPSCIGWIGYWGMFEDKTKATMLNVDTFLFNWQKYQKSSWTRRDPGLTTRCTISCCWWLKRMLKLYIYLKLPQFLFILARNLWYVWHCLSISGAKLISDLCSIKSTVDTGAR